MKDPHVAVIARRPTVYGAIRFATGEKFMVPVAEALRLAKGGIVSLTRRPDVPIAAGLPTSTHQNETPDGDPGGAPRLRGRKRTAGA
jgi:hypothetical protein